MQAPTAFFRQHSKKNLSIFPFIGLAVRHRCEVLSTVTACQHGFLKAPVHIGLVAFGHDYVRVEFQVHERVGEGYVVGKEIFWRLRAGWEAEMV